ncbi:T-cell immunoglobulin and mucin domain-containing protein 4 [Cyclopterus lumpus]|uniref:T-cell immunoglobulin and mucin domain-containing protein 4 n=1 Tax=Cyclopterus lumpus TaxID=8103 RepID=UPI001486A0EB|nr:T-cell immunoglobulin and mucin domain-containing protein 4 [Cyclopterus lumpus]
MAAVSTRCCRTPRTFIIFLFVLSGVVSETKTNVTGRNILYHSTDDGEKTCPAGAQGLYALPVLGPAGPFSPVRGFKVAEGGVASLSCQYSVKRFGLSRVCWGRGCGTFWCNNILVQTDEHGLISKVADRYRLTGDVLDGQMDLDILNVRRTDNGPYCCRVDVDGIFNDKKVIMNLRVVKVYISQKYQGPNLSSVKLINLYLSFSAPVTSSPSPPPPPTMTTASATTGGVTELSTSTVNWKTLLSSQLDLLRRNSTLLHSDAVAVEDSLPSLSLQINVPVLSLSLSVLLVLAATFLFLAFKRGIYRRALKNGCFSSEEPPHIIYEIRMKRPVQENIYTLD